MSASTLTCFSTAKSKSATPRILTQDAHKAALREGDEAQNRFLKALMIPMLWPRVLSHWTERRERRKRTKWLTQIRACASPTKVSCKATTLFFTYSTAVFQTNVDKIQNSLAVDKCVPANQPIGCNFFHPFSRALRRVCELVQLFLLVNSCLHTSSLAIFN